MIIERSENLLETKSRQYWPIEVIGSMHIIRFMTTLIPGAYLYEITDASMFLLFGGLMILDIIFGFVIYFYRTNLMQTKMKWVLIPSTSVVILLLLGTVLGIVIQPLVLLLAIMLSTSLVEIVFLIYFGIRWKKHEWVWDDSDSTN
jgi:hypothetical protein